MTARRTSDLLIEIGTEELPAADQEPLALALRDELVRRLDKCGLSPPTDHEKTFQSFWTPRRLAVLAAGVPAKEPDRESERKGPSLKAAFDAQGKPTAAAQGFARAVGVPVTALERHSRGWLVHRYVERGRSTGDVLRAILPEIFSALPLPRRMRWGSGEGAFLRPVRWLTVRYGKHTVPVEAFGVVASGASHGHRVHHPGLVQIATPGDYVAALRAANVLADPAERLAAIKNQVNAAAQSAGGVPAGNDRLYREIAGMTEWPQALAAHFDKRFLELPDTVIVTTLIHHQRFLPLRDSAGRLTNGFVAVVNLESRDPAAVIHGLERVVRPRLEDAAFYYRRDRERPLADYGKDLAGLAFAPRLGSMAEKSERLSRLAEASALAIGAQPEPARRAGRLAKCDLVTGMVFEFPELQGIIGGHYAECDDEGSEVSRAIAEQYLPAGADDALPGTPTAAALAIADRLDLLVGGFAAEMVPTGAKDPFGLRRAAFGVLRIVAEKAPRLDLDPLLERSAELFPAPLNAASALPDLRAFLRERLRSMILERGTDTDIAQAVLEVAPLVPGEVLARADALAKFRHRGEMAALAAANKRIANILRQAGRQEESAPGATSGLRTEAAELSLDAALEALQPQVEEALTRYDFETALAALTSLRNPVDRFFDEVLVMDSDPGVRARRLALLTRLRKIFLRIADIGELQVNADK